MRKILKWLGIILGGVLAVLIIAGLIMHEPPPQGKEGPEAEAMARKMLAAIDIPAWDTTHIVKWNFGGLHWYLWDRKRHFVRVLWNEQEVLLNTRTQTGRALVNGKEQAGEAAEKLIRKAWAFFCNDSFWLNAPAKVFDPGVRRSIVKLDDGSEGLLVHYSGGGVTPGDTYLWILEENGLPKRWKMWVSLIPVGGISSSWDQWTRLSTGARIATVHQTLMVNLKITELEGAGSLEALGLSTDPFEGL